MRIAVLHSLLPPDPRGDEQESLDQALLVARELDSLGHQAFLTPFELDLAQASKKLSHEAPDLVFNLVEAVAGTDRLLHLAPTILEFLSLPFTGATSEALFMTTNKLLAKKIMRRAMLPTPAWRQQGAAETFLPGYYIVKPVWEHASRAMDFDSLVAFADKKAQEKFLEEKRKKIGGECFAEIFVPGREFNVSLFSGPDGPVVLPVAEMEFVNWPPERPKIVSYAAKWDADSWEHAATHRRFLLPASDQLILKELTDLSLRCWELFGLTGYARVDFRVDEGNRPWILEINANPTLSLEGGFIAAAREGGFDFAEILRQLLQEALRRSGS